jgi:DNA-binding GntR family transcriptional regulator
MPSLEHHCRESRELFGAEFREVHQWLDAFAFRPPFGVFHRRVRHHEAGVEEVRKRFGARAALAARQHIRSDLGLQPGEPLPVDENDYVRRGFH